MKVETIKFASVRIVKDNEAQVKNVPPELETLAEARIGLISEEGGKDKGM